MGSVVIVGGLDRWREESSTEECLGLEMWLVFVSVHQAEK